MRMEVSSRGCRFQAGIGGLKGMSVAAGRDAPGNVPHRFVAFWRTRMDESLTVFIQPLQQLLVILTRNSTGFMGEAH